MCISQHFSVPNASALTTLFTIFHLTLSLVPLVPSDHQKFHIAITRIQHPQVGHQLLTYDWKFSIDEKRSVCGVAFSGFCRGSLTVIFRDSFKSQDIRIASLTNQDSMECHGSGSCFCLHTVRTQMGPLVFIGKGSCGVGLTSKNRGHLGSRYISYLSSKRIWVH